MKYLDQGSLERSSVVANSRMNRERGAVGVNSYEKDIGLDPIAFIADRLRTNGAASWLDLCCGRGRALNDAARSLANLPQAQGRVTLQGIDLVGAFDDIPEGITFLNLDAASLHHWEAARQYDLITCVHGMHYIGDRLSLIERAVSWLSDDGLFLSNLDLGNLCHEDGRPLTRQLAMRFRESGLDYNSRRHIL